MSEVEEDQIQAFINTYNNNRIRQFLTDDPKERESIQRWFDNIADPLKIKLKMKGENVDGFWDEYFR